MARSSIPKAGAHATTEEAPAEVTKDFPKPTLQTSIHEILIRNQVMSLDPPLEHARVNWISQLHAWLSIICDLDRIQSSRYDEGLSHRRETTVIDNTYRDLVIIILLLEKLCSHFFLS